MDKISYSLKPNNIFTLKDYPRARTNALLECPVQSDDFVKIPGNTSGQNFNPFTISWFTKMITCQEIVMVQDF
jgi:hypothetical protein